MEQNPRMETGSALENDPAFYEQKKPTTTQAAEMLETAENSSFIHRLQAFVDWAKDTVARGK